MDYQSMLEPALAKLREQEAQVLETKRVINTIKAWAGEPPMFTDLDQAQPGSSIVSKRAKFYGQPLSTVVRQILEARQDVASVNEIYDAMIAGQYKFDTANEENAKRGLRISLTKNSATFHKLPGGEYGLREWYPNVKESKPKAPATPVGEDHTQAPDNEDEEWDFDGKEKELAEQRK
jgi:hypothetical protein